MGHFPLCLLIFIIIAVAPVAAETYLEKYGKLRQELIDPSKYNYKVRPENETYVNITFDLRTLDKLDIASQSLSTTFLLYMSWIDERLTWAPATGIEYMIYSIKEIWTPNLVITNYMDNAGLMGIIEDGPIPLRVSSEGQVVWALREAATTTCDANVMFYPYDDQTCHIEIMEWAHPISEVDLLPLGIDKNSYLKDGEWSLEKSSQRSEEEIGSHNQTYRRIKYTFEFQRSPKWYVPVVMAPLFILSLLMPGIFVLPESSGEKMAYGLTVMLSFTFISSFLIEKLPTVSTQFSLVGVYIAATMTCGAVMILVSLMMLFYLECMKRGKESKNSEEERMNSTEESKKRGEESKDSEEERMDSTEESKKRGEESKNSEEERMNSTEESKKRGEESKNSEEERMNSTDESKKRGEESKNSEEEHKNSTEESKKRGEESKNSEEQEVRKKREAEDKQNVERFAICTGVSFLLAQIVMIAMLASFLIYHSGSVLAMLTVPGVICIVVWLAGLSYVKYDALKKCANRCANHKLCVNIRSIFKRKHGSYENLDSTCKKGIRHGVNKSV